MSNSTVDPHVIVAGPQDDAPCGVMVTATPTGCDLEVYMGQEGIAAELDPEDAITVAASLYRAARVLLGSQAAMLFRVLVDPPASTGDA